MNKYVKPSVEVVEFDAVDVILESTTGGNTRPPLGDDDYDASAVNFYTPV